MRVYATNPRYPTADPPRYYIAPEDRALDDADIAVVTDAMRKVYEARLDGAVAPGAVETTIRALLASILPPDADFVSPEGRAALDAYLAPFAEALAAARRIDARRKVRGVGDPSAYPRTRQP